MELGLGGTVLYQDITGWDMRGGHILFCTWVWLRVLVHIQWSTDEDGSRVCTHDLIHDWMRLSDDTFITAFIRQCPSPPICYYGSFRSPLLHNHVLAPF